MSSNFDLIWGSETVYNKKNKKAINIRFTICVKRGKEMKEM